MFSCDQSMCNVREASVNMTVTRGVHGCYMTQRDCLQKGEEVHMHPRLVALQTSRLERVDPTGGRRVVYHSHSTLHLALKKKTTGGGKKEEKMKTVCGKLPNQWH